MACLLACFRPYAQWRAASTLKPSTVTMVTVIVLDCVRLNLKPHSGWDIIKMSTDSTTPPPTRSTLLVILSTYLLVMLETKRKQLPPTMPGTIAPADRPPVIPNTLPKCSTNGESMTLTEAIRSGKKFKRRGGITVYWTAKDSVGHVSVVCADPSVAGGVRFLMKAEPVTAADYELVALPDNVIEFKPKGVK